MEKFSIDEIIELAIQIEKNGYTFYDRALERKDLTENSRNVLEHLRQEEVKHEQTFKALRSGDVNRGDLVSWQEVSSYLKTIAGAHIFNRSDSAIKLAVDARDELEIIENAIQFEKDTLLFFHSIYRNTNNNNTKNVLNTIIDEEVAHVTKLIELSGSL